MSLRQEIETWVAAAGCYDNNEFDESLKYFETIADTSKILFNCGVIYATLGEHGKAVQYYQRAIQLDNYLAVAYYQQGVSNFLVGDFEEALANFNDTLLYLRGNRNIDYEQLGLKYKLHSCEVLFNRGLCYIYLQQEQIGMQDLQFAAREKSTPDHDVIDEAIREKAEGYTVFSIPIGTIYRPNEAKVKNLKTRNYLGSARLVATRDLNHLDADGRRHIQAANLAVDDRPSDKLSYGALNLVRPGLTSRSRQQSEPPMHRNVFPPTPPPEMVERPPSSASRRRSGDSLTSQKSNRTATSKPRKLDLSLAGFERPQVVPERPRLGTVRSASERPRANREYSSSSPRSLGQRRGDTRSLVEDPSQHRSESQPKQQQQHQLQPQAYHARSKSTTRDLMHRPVSIEEEDETETETETEITPPSTTSSDHDPPLAFEIITRPPHHRSRSSRGGAPKPSASPPASPLRKIRVKVYAEDTRYVMILPSVRYEDFEQQVRVKFGLRGEFRLKMRDEEGDMVTMADQEDLDMAVASCREGAGRERCEMGKMEPIVFDVRGHAHSPIGTVAPAASQGPQSSRDHPPKRPAFNVQPESPA